MLLAPEPRPSADAEARLQGSIFPSVLDSCPDEQADDKCDGEHYEDGDHDRCCDIHVNKVFPPQPVSSPINAREQRPYLSAA